MANVYRRAAEYLERNAMTDELLLGCCEAIGDCCGYQNRATAVDEFAALFKPNEARYFRHPDGAYGFWWPLDQRHVLPRLVALDLMALIAEDEA